LPDLINDLGQATEIPRHLESVHGNRANDVTRAEEQVHRLNLADRGSGAVMTQQRTHRCGA
jgi:hypothetical protein